MNSKEQPAKTLTKMYDLLMDFVSDLAKHGTRHDTQPTVEIPLPESVDEAARQMRLATSYHKHMGSMHETIKNRAKRVLGELALIGQEEKEQ